jgi:hypothetical protein
VVQARFDFDLSRYIFVYLDLGEYLHKTSQDFFYAVSKRILAQSRGLSGIDLRVEDEGEEEFSRILEQIRDQGFFPVLLLDSFEDIALNPQFDSKFFRFLRAQAAMDRVSYVTATIAPLARVAHRDIVGSPFFNIFYNYALGPLTFEEARELIEKPAQRAGLPFTEEEAALIVKMAGRHPFFIQRVCYYSFEEKMSQKSGLVDERRVRKLAYEDLQPFFVNLWDRLSEQDRAALQDEAQRAEKDSRALPELSESALFRKFVRDTRRVGVFKMTSDELEYALDTLDDAAALGETNLRLMNLVAQRLNNDVSSTPVERGMVIRSILTEAFERLRGPLLRSDTDPALLPYNSLYYRYFKHHLKNEQIAARLSISVRQYFRYRTRAIEALLDVLREMENAANLVD